MAKRKNKSERLESAVKDYEHDLFGNYGIDGMVLNIMDSLEKRVSPGLVELMKEMMLGFNETMQLEMAEYLADFAYRHVMHTTGCMTADAVLSACYVWIGEEQGIVYQKKLKA